jgi:hypothetical protein
MQRAKLNLLRCENLDLFAGQASLQTTPTQPGPETFDSTQFEPGLLFRIGPDDQLDLFVHSPAEIAATEARRALRILAAERARGHLVLLRQAPAYATFVADSDQCLELIERCDARWADPAVAVPWIEGELWQAADRCLQHDAMLLVRPALLALLESSEPRAFDPDCRHAHRSYLWQLLGQPAQAVAALEDDPRWRDRVETLLWHAELAEAAQLHERVHADIAELCLAHPDHAETWLSASRSWAARWSAWCDLDDALPMHAFPAWSRLTRASDFQLPAETDQRPGAQLLRMAHQLAADPTNLALRKALSALSPALLATFLAARAARNG